MIIISVTIISCIIGPHHSTTYVDAAYCYHPSSEVCLSVSNSCKPCKNGWTDRDAVWVVDSGGPKEECVTGGHIGETWQIRLNRPCAAAMRPYVKLLWSLAVIILRICLMQVSVFESAHWHFVIIWLIDILCMTWHQNFFYCVVLYCTTTKQLKHTTFQPYGKMTIRRRKHSSSNNEA